MVLSFLCIKEIKSLKKKLHVSEDRVEELEATVKELKESEESSSFLHPPLIDLDASMNSENMPSRDFNSPIPTDTKEVSFVLPESVVRYGTIILERSFRLLGFQI